MYRALLLILMFTLSLLVYGVGDKIPGNIPSPPVPEWHLSSKEDGLGNYQSTVVSHLSGWLASLILENEQSVSRHKPDTNVARQGAGVDRLITQCPLQKKKRGKESTGAGGNSDQGQAKGRGAPAGQSDNAEKQEDKGEGDQKPDKTAAKDGADTAELPPP